MSQKGETHWENQCGPARCREGHCVSFLGEGTGRALGPLLPPRCDSPSSLRSLLAQVLFHVNNGAGRITATFRPGGGSRLCDGKWHTLHASKSRHRLVLSVDGRSVSAESPHRQSTSADTNDPIYVGGFPGTWGPLLGLSTRGLGHRAGGSALGPEGWEWGQVVLWCQVLHVAEQPS